MIIYEVRANETLEHIASRYMGDASRWREIRLLKSCPTQEPMYGVDEFKFTKRHNILYEGDVLLVPCSLNDDVPLLFDWPKVGSWNPRGES